MKCPECQHENREGAKFCLECGAKLESLCPECGAELPPAAKFCDECGTRIVGDTTSPAETVAPQLEDMHAQLQRFIPKSLAERIYLAEQEMEGENRLVTALFADISGFTPMSQQLSPEASVEKVNQCFQMITDAVYRYEGNINRFIGDCVLAFFGAPLTHENDTERAILAALDMREAVSHLGLSISVGINTGMAYFGSIGTERHPEISAYGHDINLAKRFQEMADPGQILVGAGTYRLTRRAFDFHELGEVPLKGIASPVPVYEVLNIKERPEKLRGIEGLRANMIGRDREFADLKEAADNLIDGKGSIVSVIGEAGLGKSRLALELKEYLSDKDITWYEGRSISIGQTVSYWPFMDMLRAYLNLSDASSESEVANKLKEAMIELFPKRWEDILPFLGHLLSIKFGDELDNRLSYFTPEQIRHQTLMRLRDVFIAISHEKPLLLILEDLHWADDLSLDLVSLLMDELAANPLMLLCIYRPEREHRCWQIGDVASRKCLESYTEIRLRKLSSIQSRELVESLLTIDNLPQATKDMILSKTEGNPFFIEEVIRCLIDRDIIYRENDRWKARENIQDIDVPDTIQSVLLSRVDRLEAETKYILQCASVIGRLFRYRLLEHISQHEQNLEEHLSQLEQRDLVYEERTVPEIEYAFKHVLTQESTYQGILERRRQQFHQRVADGIEVLYQERIEDFYEELAHHHRLSGNDEKAIDYLLKSGIKAAGNFLNQDALRYFDQTEELLARSKRPHPKEKLTLHSNRGAIMHRIGQWTLAFSEYEKALEWCDEPHARSEIYRKMGEVKESMGDVVSAFRYMDLGLNELPDGDKSIQRVRLEYAFLWVWSGGQSSRRLGGRYTADIAEEMGYQRELALMWAAIEHWQSAGDIYSDEYGQKGLAVARELGDPLTLAEVYLLMGHTRLYMRDGLQWTEQSIPYYLRAAEIFERIGEVASHAEAWGRLGQAYRELARDEDAIESWEKVLDISAGTRSVYGPLLLASNILEIYGERGQEEMLVSTFSRIMGILASLELDDESQAWGLIMGRYGSLYGIYQTFQNGYRSLGKESEFPNAIQGILGDLLRQVNSRPQMAWYHAQLMDLCLRKEETSAAKAHAQEVVSIVDDMGSPDYMTKFYPAYIMMDDISEAHRMASRLFIREVRPTMSNLFLTHFSSWIAETEDTYSRLGHAEAFQQLRMKIEQGQKEATVNTLSPKPAGNMEHFPKLEFEDSFDSDSLLPDWEWVDPEEASSYTFRHDLKRIEISAACDSLLGFSPDNAPRLCLFQPISGDFAVETRMGMAKLGGLFLQQGDDYYTLQRCPLFGKLIMITHPNELYDRALLISESLILRLERRNNRIFAYYSDSGEDWYTFIWMANEGPVQLGIFASCPDDAPQAITSFDYFRIYR
jgi:class 3 adenylate cyclase/tetratricopeptide (TPR) repeat protein